MPKHSIRIVKAAEDDIVSIADYIARNNVAADVDLVDRFERAILHLEDFPLSDTVPKNRILARKGYRIRIVDDYLIFYCVLDKDTVEVRRVISGKMDYRFLL